MTEMSSNGQIKTIIAQQSWKNVPLVVGGKELPNAMFKDLVQFEELSDYSLVNDGVDSIPEPKSPPKSLKGSGKHKKKSRLEKQRALKRKLLEPEASEINTKVAKKPKKSHDTVSKSKGKKKNNSIKQEETQKNSDETPVNLADVSAWENLFVPDCVLKALAELGFSKPMPIQEQIFPAAIRDKRDVLGAAETGSGKTLAFGIPLIHHLLEDKERNLSATTHTDLETQIPVLEEGDLGSDFEEDIPEVLNKSNKTTSKSPGEKILPALILTPTRELAIQVKNHLTSVGKHSGLWTAAIVGGMSAQKQTRLLSKKPDIVIATPGRLWELIESGNPYLSNLHNLGYLVIDEADRMLEKGHFEDLTKLLDVMNSKERNKKRQTYIFSATLTTVHRGPERKKSKWQGEDLTKTVKLEKLTKRIGMRQKPFVVDLTTSKVTAETLSEAKIVCQVAEKDFYLYYFIKSFLGRTLIFTNSIDCIFRLSGILEVLGCSPLHIHAKMQQRQRLKHLERFQANDNAILIASDVAARGLDIPDVKHVIHYQVPRTMETYIHRSGRAARSGKNGLSLLFVSPEEMLFYKRICRSLRKDDAPGGGFPLFLVDQNFMGAVRKRVNVARDVDKMTHAIKKTNLHNDWFRKNAEAMEIDLDEDQLIQDDEEDEKKQLLASKRQQLNALLKKPIFPKGFSGKFITKQGSLMKPGLSSDDVFTRVNPSRNKNRKKTK